MSGWEVDYASAMAAVDETEGEIGTLADGSAALAGAISAAEGALPPEWSHVGGLLAGLRTTHQDDLTTVQTFAEGCVEAARGVLASYENAEAEMVVQSHEWEQLAVFDHPSILGQTGRELTERANDRLDRSSNLPERDEGRSEQRTKTVTENEDGRTVKTESETDGRKSSSTRGGSGSLVDATEGGRTVTRRPG